MGPSRETAQLADGPHGTASTGSSTERSATSTPGTAPDGTPAGVRPAQRQWPILSVISQHGHKAPTDQGVGATVDVVVTMVVGVTVVVVAGAVVVVVCIGGSLPTGVLSRSP